MREKNGNSPAKVPTKKCFVNQEKVSNFLTLKLENLSIVF